MSKLLEGLRGEREAVATGRLSFDREEARAKMRMFRLPNPHFYVLQFVRAASVLGAGHIDFELSANRMVCTFANRLDTDRFDDFWGAVFDARETAEQRALHNIALGIGSAQALKPKEIRLQSGDREIVFTDDGEEVRNVTTGPGTRIEMTEKFRFGQILDFFTDHAELIALRDHCRYSEILVTVDGESIRTSFGQFRTKFKARNESGFVALRSRQIFDRGPEVREVLAGPGGKTTFHFLRDDVLVRSHTVKAHLVPAIGAVNSTLLRTDLSGLELADDEMLDQLLYDKLYAAYHSSLLRWLEKPTTTVDMVELGQLLFRHIEVLRKMDFEPPPGTRKLAMDWWRRQAIFMPALGNSMSKISVTDVEHDGVIPYSSRRLSHGLTEHRQVIYAQTSSEQLLMNQLRVAGLRTEDVTLKLSRAADAARQKRNWENQPKRSPFFYPVLRTVEIGDAVGELFVPLSPEGKLHGLEHVFTTYSGGRRLLRRPLKMSFGMLVDGPLKVDDMYRDVVRDETFSKLAEKLVGQVPYLVRDIVRHAARSGASVDTVTTAMHLLDGYLSGELFQLVSDELRYPMSDLVPDELRVDNETDRLTLLSKLGEIAEIAFFQTVTGEQRSLRQLYEAAEAPVVLDHRLVVTDEIAVMLSEMGRDVFTSLPAGQRILRQIRPDAQDKRFIGRAMNEVRFMSKPLFELPQFEALATSSNRGVTPRYTIEVELIGEGGECEVYFVYRDRLLVRRSLASSAGRFRAVVHSEEMTPTFDFSDVSNDLLFQEICQEITLLTGIALSNWCMKTRVEESLDPGHFRLLWDASVMWAQSKPRALTIPVWQWRGSWERDVISLEDLKLLAEKQGGVLRVHRGQDPPPLGEAGHTIVRCPVSANLEALLPVRYVEVDTPIDDAARTRFMQRPKVVREMPYAAFEWSGEIDGVRLKIGMFPESSGRPFGHTNEVQVLWKDRRLEQVSQPVPFGSFRTLAESSSVTPDPSHEFAATGRADLLRSAELGVALLLEDLCKKLHGRRDAALRALGRLVPDLLHIFAACQRNEPPAPFDLLDTLRSTPIYDTTFGPRLAFDELDSLALEGVIPYVTRESFERALLVDPSLVPVIEETLAPDYALLPLSVVRKILGDPESPAGTTARPAVQPPDRSPRDPLLESLVETLDGARGAWLPDSVLIGMKYDDNADLCQADLDGIRLQRRHPLVEFCGQDPSDSIPMLFLASVVGSSVNRHLQVVTDVHELELQAALIAAVLEDG